ncbi:MAG: RNA 2',3'-cyclic phosphodiesterase [Candidatus Aminicenantes bacterium]|nr:RNA 2',3'-cyclic phosphodiesterase [Candidatus Aminicenantes bacterium]
MRTFIAVDLPADIKTRISGFIQKLKSAAPRGIGWANFGDLHVTLKFLGEIEESCLLAIGEAVRTVAAETPIFPLTVAGTGAFPPLSRHPRVLWIGLEDSPMLLDLQGRLDNALEALGFPRDQRPFHPHLTAARVKSAEVPCMLLDRLAKDDGALFGNMEVREIVVYQSILRPGGAEHRPLLSGALRS